MANNYIEQFITRVIKEAGLDKMPKDFLDEYARKLSEEAKKRLGVAVMKELDESEIEQLNKIMGKAGSEDEVNNFLASRVENFGEKMAAALEEFGREVIEKAKSLAV